MPKRTNIGSDAARMARAAASDLASLQRAMRAAEDSVAGLNRAIKVPNTNVRPRMIRGSRKSPPLVFSMLGSSLGSFVASGFSPDGFGNPQSFLPSAGQFAAQITSASMRGQRIL